MRRSNKKAFKNGARLILAAAALLTAAYLSSTRLHADVTTGSAEAVVSGEVVVEIKPGATIDAVNQRNRTTTIERISGTNFYRLQIPAGKREKKWQKLLAADPDVLSATPNSVLASPLVLFGRRTLAFPSNQAEPGHSLDEYLHQQWMQNLRIDDAQVRSRGRGVVVAVIDTGVDVNHPALAGHLWVDNRPNADKPGDGIDNDGDGYVDDYAGWNFVDNNNDVNDTPGDPATTIAGHGTFIAGLIALMAPDAKIMPVKAFPPSGVTNAFIVAAAVKYAADHGADIINLSFGSPSPSGVLGEALADAQSRGILMSAAVGNDGKDLSIFPANSGKAIGVAAVGNDNVKASFSNFGSDVCVDAPGVNIISAYPGGQYAQWSGTSFSAPLVSAEGALLLGDYKDVPDPPLVIESTAISIDALNPAYSGMLGKGLINPSGALQSINFGPKMPKTNDIAGQLDLAPGPDENARGLAALSVTGSGQDLAVYGAALNPRARYHLFVNGTEIGQGLVATSMGSLSVDFSSQPGPGQLQLPPDLQPVTSISHLELRDDQGGVYLLGTFAPISVGTGPTYQTVSKEASLQSASGGEESGGRATVGVNVWRETLTVEAEGITDSACQIFIDGRLAGYAPQQYGYIRLQMSSDGSQGQLLPAWLRPVFGLKHVEVRDSTGTTVLAQGDLGSDSSDLGGPESGGPGGWPGENFSFEGVIQALPSAPNWLGDWIVDGRTVHVSASTEIKLEGGVIAVGAPVQVTGVVQPDGSVSADEMDLISNSEMSGGGDGGGSSGGGSGGDGGDQGGGGGSGGGGGDSSIDFMAAIQAFPAGLIGDWLVGGIVVHVSSSTDLQLESGPVAVGVSVEVKGTVRADQSVDAASIEIKSSGGGSGG